MKWTCDPSVLRRQAGSRTTVPQPLGVLFKFAHCLNEEWRLNNSQPSSSSVNFVIDRQAFAFPVEKPGLLRRRTSARSTVWSCRRRLHPKRRRRFRHRRRHQRGRFRQHSFRFRFHLCSLNFYVPSSSKIGRYMSGIVLFPAPWM